MEAARFADLHPDDPAWGHGEVVDTRGIRMHYVRPDVRGGIEPPVVLLHGWPGFWYDWRRVLPKLAGEADAVAPDLVGFGASDKPDPPTRDAYGEEAQARSVLALMRELNLSPAVLVGNDVGSRVAQALARLAPEHVRALVLCPPSYPGFGERRFEPEAQREYWYQHFHALPQADAIIGRDRETVRLYLSHFYGHWLGRKEALESREFDAIVDIYAREGAVRGSLGWVRSGAGTGAARTLHGRETEENRAALRIEHPTWVVWGELDPIYPPEWSDRLPEFFPDPTIRLLAGVGHFVPFEAPEEVLTAVRAAL